MRERMMTVLVGSCIGVLLAGCGGTAPRTEASSAPVESEANERASGADTPMDAETAARLQEIGQICREVACRPDTEVTLMVDEDRYFQTTVHGSPYIYDGLVSVLAGEEIHLEGEVGADGVIANLRYVPEIVNPEKTISITLFQAAEGRVHKTMMMKITSGFGGNVRYTAGIMPPGSNDIFRTSTCPLHSGIPSMEMWQDLIMAVHLTDFHIENADDPNAGSCH